MQPLLASHGKRNTARSDRPGWLYVIRSGEAVKIGFTSSCPQKRLKALQTGSPAPLKLIGLKWASKAEEREMHRILAAYRVQGEWFDINGLPVGVLVERLEADPAAAGVL